MLLHWTLQVATLHSFHGLFLNLLDAREVVGLKTYNSLERWSRRINVASSLRDKALPHVGVVTCILLFFHFIIRNLACQLRLLDPIIRSPRLRNKHLGAVSFFSKHH